MNIFAFFESDYNFSAMLAKICDIESDSLIFMDKVNSLQKYPNKESAIIIIDIDDYKNSLDELINGLRKNGSYPVYGLISKMDIEIQKYATKIGFDIVMTKSNFLHNIKTIKKKN